MFNLFAGSIPQAGLTRMERRRKVQSIVPDLRICLQVQGNPVQRLHELKVISSSKTRYKPRRQGQEAVKAVDKRAGELPQEYLAKARKTDRKYCGTLPETTGPVETKLVSMGKVEGLVFGAFGEASQATHSLLHHLATSTVQVAGPQRGRRGQPRGELAEVDLVSGHGLSPSHSICGGSQGPGLFPLGEAGGAWSGGCCGSSQAFIRPAAGVEMGQPAESSCSQCSPGPSHPEKRPVQADLDSI